MNPSEYIELILLARESGSESAMNFVTLVFAYLVMVYFVGASLPKLQIWLVSLLYSFFVAFPVFGAVQDFRTLNALVSDFYARHPTEANKFVTTTLAPWQLFVGVAIVSWLLSIGFVVYMRIKTDPNGND